jgi:hypothetical protein
MPHKFCPSCEGNVVCDFCTHYDFNGEDLPLPAKPGNRQSYAGEGWCRQYGRHEDPGGPGGPCDSFECRRLSRGAKPLAEEVKS